VSTSVPPPYPGEVPKAAVNPYTPRSQSPHPTAPSSFDWPSPPLRSPVYQPQAWWEGGEGSLPSLIP
uniref:Uncharacterized protein n=1 Tax=Mustela putorius furo TaxID=9669 RepID=M3YCF6_MUSPF